MIWFVSGNAGFTVPNRSAAEFPGALFYGTLNTFILGFSSKVILFFVGGKKIQKPKIYNLGKLCWTIVKNSRNRKERAKSFFSSFMTNSDSHFMYFFPLLLLPLTGNLKMAQLEIFHVSRESSWDYWGYVGRKHFRVCKQSKNCFQFLSMLY